MKNAKSVEKLRLLTSPLTVKIVIVIKLTTDAKSAVIVPKGVVTNLLSKSRTISLMVKNAALISRLKNAKTVLKDLPSTAKTVTINLMKDAKSAATVRLSTSLSTVKNGISTNLSRDAKSAAGHPLIASLLTLTNVRAMQTNRMTKKNATVRKMGNAVV